MKTPVLVVGGGPVGLGVAGDLGMRDVHCTLIEKTDGVVGQPKMDTVHARIMEFCRRWGIVPWVEAAGFNRDYSQDYAWVTALHNGYELGREPSPPCAKAPPLPQSPQHRERCPQTFFDPVMQRFARQFHQVTLHYHTELVTFEERPDRVLARVRNTQTGDEHVIEADYLVAADGSASSVREQLGIGMSGHNLLTNTTNVIFHSTELEKLITIPQAYRYIFIGPEEGTWATIVCIDGRDNWRFSFVGDRNRLELGEPELREFIERAVGCKFKFEINSVLRWTRRELVADRYGTDRVFLVGDSAHQLSPTGGFGMTTGLQEAVDIGWKLAAVVKGWGGASLLKSYEAERQPVAARNVREAHNNLLRMLTPCRQKPLKLILEPGPRGDAARKAYGDAYTEMMKPEWHALGVTMGYRYDGSPIVVGDGTLAPIFNIDYVQSTLPGGRAPHVWLDEAKTKSTLDLYGKGFVLVRLARDSSEAVPNVDALVAAAGERGVPLEVVDLVHAEARALYARQLVLVRPDGHVAWRSDAAPEDALAIIDTVRGAG